MLFQKKIDRAEKWHREKTGLSETDSEVTSELKTPKEIWAEEAKEAEKLAPSTIWAAIISALIVFGPILIVLMGLCYLAFLWLVS